MLVTMLTACRSAHATTPGTPAEGMAPPWSTPDCSGAKLTPLPLVGWMVKGGQLAVGFTLFHNSAGTYNAELGPKWSHSYDADLSFGLNSATVKWGDRTGYNFTLSGGSWVPDAGWHDSLASVGSPVTAYDLTTKDGIKYRFGAQDASYVWHLTLITDRSGNTVTINRDSANGYRVSSVSDNTSRSLSFSYTSGKLTGVTDPLSRTFTFSYTGGVLSSVAYPSVGGNSYSTSFSYDGSNRITTLTDRRGKNWVTHYDTSGRVDYREDPCGNRVSYAYGTNCTEIEDPNGNLTVQNFNSDGSLASITDPANNSLYLTYDSDMNVTQATDYRGKVWNLEYDSSGNCTSFEDPNSHTTSLTYNSFSELTQVTYPAGNYDSFTYDTNGNLTDWYRKESDGTTDPGNRSMTLSYDALGRLISTGSTNRVTQYDYDENGNITTITYPNSFTANFTYNDAGQLDTLTNKDASDNTVDSFTLTYNANGQVTESDEGGGNCLTLGYDGIGRLTSEERTGTGSYTKSLTYNSLGQISSMTLGGTTTTYNYDSTTDLLTSTTGGIATSYSYDNRYRVSSFTKDGVSWTNTWSRMDELTTLYNAVDTILYFWKPSGERYYTLLDAAYYIIYYPLLDCLSYDGGTYEYFGGPGPLVTNWGPESYLPDPFGNVRRHVDSSGNTTFTEIDDLFGNAVYSSGSTLSPHGYRGMRGVRNDFAGNYYVGDGAFSDPNSGSVNINQMIGRRIPGSPVVLPGLDPFGGQFSPLWPPDVLQPIPMPNPTGFPIFDPLPPINIGDPFWPRLPARDPFEPSLPGYLNPWFPPPTGGPPEWGLPDYRLPPPRQKFESTPPLIKSKPGIGIKPPQIR
jgi:YD repeat-containing protein